EFRVRYAKNGTVGDSWHPDQHRFYLGWINVHASRDQKILDPIAQVQEPVFRYVADIASRKTGSAKGRLPFVIVIMVGEVRHASYPADDFSRGARRHFLAVRVNDLQVCLGQHLAYSARMSKPFPSRAE